MVRAQCVFGIYSLPPPWGISSLKSRSIPQVRFLFMFSLLPSPMPMPLCRISLSLFIVLYLLGVFLSGFLTRLYTDLSIRESINISGPQGEYIYFGGSLTC